MEAVRWIVGLLLVGILVTMIITFVGGPMVDAGDDVGSFLSASMNDSDGHITYSRPLALITLLFSGMSPDGELSVVGSFLVGGFLTVFVAWLLWPLIQKVFGS